MHETDNNQDVTWHDPASFQLIKRRCFINAPFDLLSTGLLNLFLLHRLQPEIGLEGCCLWDKGQKHFASLAEALGRADLRCTLHAPFLDLSPGAFDPKIREVSQEKLRRAFDLTGIFSPESIVCHLGYEDNKHQGKFTTWLDNALHTWEALLTIAVKNGTRVMFENTYEKSPEVHRKLFERLNCSHLGFCLDTGHTQAFAHTPWQPWIDELGPWLGQIHLHDNDTTGDDHLAIGRGCFDFQGLFDHLKASSRTPIITLEPHTEEDLWHSLAAIEEQGLFTGLAA
ncbi:sugar phosphate isomerase/epimerase family protein [Desulfolithobacter sp.]